MSFFDQLLKNHKQSECPLPLWKLKITDEEFEALRDLLEKETKYLGRSPFAAYPRECCLFFAEYWRRLYIKGSHSKQMVMDAICKYPARRDCDFTELLYTAAKVGARALGIERYTNANKTLDSMLYQGGLPLQSIYTPETGSNWDRFAQGLVFRNVDFEALSLGVIAKSNRGLREFCNQLCDAVNAKQYKMLPFYSEGEYNPIFQFFLNKFKAIKREQRQSRPFSLDWVFEVDEISGKLKVGFEVSSSQKLPLVFLEQQGLENTKFFNVRVERNGRSAANFSFIDGFCHSEVKYHDSYSEGDEISVILNDKEIPLISEVLDLDYPHLLYQDDDYRYRLGNQIGNRKSWVIFSQSWNPETEGLDIIPIKWRDLDFKVIRVPDNFDGEIVLKSDDDTLRFNTTTKFAWTEILSQGKAVAEVKECVYDAGITTFSLCKDKDYNRKFPHFVEQIYTF